MAETIFKGKKYTVEDILREETTPYELHDKIKSFVRKNPQTIDGLEDIVFKMVYEEFPLEEETILTINRKNIIKKKINHIGIVDILLLDNADNVYIIEVKENSLHDSNKRIKASHFGQVVKYYNYYNRRKIKCSVYLVGIEDGILVSEKINFNESHSASR